MWDQGILRAAAVNSSKVVDRKKFAAGLEQVLLWTPDSPIIASLAAPAKPGK
jgi:hypothetical protein